MAYNLYDSDGCAQIHDALQDFREGVIGVLITAMPFKCPAAPYEAAFLAESFIRKRGIRRNVEIHLFTPEHTPMPVAPPSVGDSIADMLAARGIHYHPLFTFNELRPETSEVVSSDGQAHTIDLLIAIPPHQAPDVVRSSPLLGVSGFIHVDPRTLQTDHDDVYAIGDVATVKLPNGKALPKAGVFAHSEAKVVAQQIADHAHGKTVRRLIRRQGLLLDRARRQPGRIRRRQLLRRTRPPTRAEETRTPAALEQGRLREVVAPPLAVAAGCARSALWPRPRRVRPIGSQRSFFDEKRSPHG